MVAVQRFSRTATAMYFDRDIAPIGSVRSGETFEVETADSLCGLIKSEADVLHNFHDVIDRLGGANPVTGPIYIERARVGDCIAVRVEDIVAAPRSHRGWTAVVPGWGGLNHDMGYTLQDPLAPRTTVCHLHGDVIEMDLDGHSIHIPARPFIGTIGVAPIRERRMTLSQSGEYLGDVDIPSLGPSSTLILPVHVDGALLALGDVHAAQGEGEITGVAVEVEADVKLHVNVLSRDEAEFGQFPMVETDEWVGVIVGMMGVSLTSCIRAGYVDLCRRLQRYYGFSREGAYTLLGQVGRIQVGNLIDPFYSCLVRLDRKYLE